MIFKTVISPALVLFPLFLVLSACGSSEERPEYLDAGSVSSLQIPPKLSQPNTRNALNLPQPSETAMKASSEQIAMAVDSFPGVSLEHDSDVYWLALNVAKEDIWASLPLFLASEGIEVERVETLLGYVDTKWMNEYEITYDGDSGGGIASLFKTFSADYKDKFRIRVESADDPQDSRLYVAHRGLQIQVQGDESAWVQRQSEPLLEREIMYRYMLYLGSSQEGAIAALVDYKTFQPRVRVKEDKQLFEVMGDGDITWARLQHQLDRLGAEVISIDEQGRRIEFTVGKIDENIAVQEAEEGWFSSLFGGGKDIIVDEDDEPAFLPDREAEQAAAVEAKGSQQRVRLALQQQAQTNSSLIRFELSEGVSMNNELVSDFRTALLVQMN